MSPKRDLLRADVVMHRIGAKQTRARLCQALDLRPSHLQLGPLPGVFRLGAWRPRSAAEFPTMLAIATDARSLADLVAEAGSSIDRPGMMITPTQMLWSEQSEAIASAMRITLAPLDDVVEVRGEDWVAAPAWADYLGTFMSGAGVAIPAAFSPKPKKQRVAKASATAGRIKDALRQWYRSAQDHLRETGELLPPPEVAFLAHECGVSHSTASRWLRGKVAHPDQELVILWRDINARERVQGWRDL